MNSSRRLLRFFLVVLLCILTVAGPNARFESDNDGDGIDDGLEQYLAEAFLPTIHYAGGDSCPDPDPQPVIFRARHPSWFGDPDENFILINYVQLYDEDCGANGHNGDNEPFMVWLYWTGSNWSFYSLQATAHWGATCETLTDSFSLHVWVGDDKHGTYADPGECGCFGGDGCSNPGWTKDHVLYNAGEPNNHLMDGLGSVANYWSSESIWSDGQFLSAGTISDQLYNTNFVKSLFPGPTASQACYDQCWNNAIAQCNADFSDQQCYQNYETCNNDCYAYRYYWGP